MSRREDEGFTLVEVLIALALVGMLTVLAYAAVQYGNLSWLHVQTRRDSDADREAVRKLISQSIAGAYPSYASADRNDTSITFTGNAGSLELVAPLPEALSPGIMAVERFGLGTSDNRSDLMMSWRLDLPAAGGGLLSNQTVKIAKAVRAIRYAYFGWVKEGQPPAWFDTWIGMDHLPALVRVSIWRGAVAELPWLDFSVETVATVNVACAYDLIDSRCRRME